MACDGLQSSEPTNKASRAIVTLMRLWNIAPRYEFELHPGDVLFFPPWMWHKTINLNEEGLGITCRYTAPTEYFQQVFPRSATALRRFLEKLHSGHQLQYTRQYQCLAGITLGIMKQETGYTESLEHEQADSCCGSAHGCVATPGTEGAELA